MNARQRCFVEQFLLDPCAGRAARRAGYSPKTADRLGSRLLKNVEVAAAAKQAQEERAKRTKVDADRVVEELASVAFSRMGDFYDKDSGRLLTVTEMRPEAQARLSSIKVLREKTHTTTDGVTETSVHESTLQIKLWDKLRSLELLGRHLGMFKDQVQHSGEVSLLDALRRIEAKEDAAQRRPTEAGVTP